MSWFQKLMDAIQDPFLSPEASLDKKAAARPDLHWRTSVVDLMKLVGEDSSIEARVRLARELQYSGPLDGGVAMNDFLHRHVLESLGVKS
jgi:hypothetical protein